MKKLSVFFIALMGVMVAGCNQSDEQFENAKAEGLTPQGRLP